MFIVTEYAALIGTRKCVTVKRMDQHNTPRGNFLYSDLSVSINVYLKKKIKSFLDQQNRQRGNILNSHLSVSYKRKHNKTKITKVPL